MANRQVDFSIGDLSRVNVVGVSGSGKSWLAKRLQSALTPQEYSASSPIKLIELDQLYWLPNWEEPTPDDFRAKLRKAIACDRWIIDGNYHSKTHDIKWRDATMVVWVDNSFLRTVWQAATRAAWRSWNQQELWPGTGNRETFRKSFLSSDSVVLWTISSFAGIRQRYSTLETDHGRFGFRFIRLRNRTEVAAYLERVRTCASSTR